MKILKTCKVEAMKEKKLKKSERLFKKVQMMKRIKVDEVTKFALLHSDIEEFLKTPKLNLRQNALAYLAKHEAVATKVNLIRNQIENWEMELPLLLNSLGKKKNKAVIKQGTSGNSKTQKHKETQDGCTVATSSKKVMKKGGNDKELRKNMTAVENKVRQSGKADNKHSVSIEGKTNDETKKMDPIKIDDPFFIGKKIVAPKLVLESLTNKKNSDKLEKIEFLKRDNSSVFETKHKRAKRNPYDFKQQKLMPGAGVETLHPSWAAKKVKLIKPFLGKKITFSDE